ncbi:MAG: SDR family oxidoreductase [Anaerolineales bacterium]
MDLGLKGKRAIVTAASRGLGQAAALALAIEGAQLAICSHSDQIEQAAGMIEQAAGEPVFFQKVDLTQPEQIQAFVQAAADELGGVDILIANAGGPPSGSFLDLTPDDWQQAVDITLMSCVHLCYAVVPAMAAQGSGSIVASQSYSVKQPIANLTLSNAIRLSVIGLVKTLANELGPHGIRVNSINPAWTDTERVEQIMQARAKKSGLTVQQEVDRITAEIPLGRMGTAEEYGRTVAWLASPAASFIHGHALMFDGGGVQAPL